MKRSIATLIAAAILIAGCAGSDDASAGADAEPSSTESSGEVSGDRPDQETEDTTGAEGVDTPDERLQRIADAVDAWAASADLEEARSHAETAANLIVGPGGLGFGDRDGDGTVNGDTAVGLLPGPDGSPTGIVLGQIGQEECVDRDVLGGSWDDPVERWSILDTAIGEWSRTNNTFPTLPSHPMRIVGWATLTQASDFEDAIEFAGHAGLHVDVSRDASRQLLTLAPTKPVGPGPAIESACPECRQGNARPWREGRPCRSIVPAPCPCGLNSKPNSSTDSTMASSTTGSRPTVNSSTITPFRAIRCGRRSATSTQTASSDVNGVGAPSSIVRNSSSRSAAPLYSLFQSIESAGIEQHSQVVAQREEVNMTAAGVLGLPLDTAFFFLERIRSAGKEPLAIDRTWVPLSIGAPLLDVTFGHTALYDEMERHCRMRPDAGWERIAPLLPSPAERAQLQLRRGQAAFFLERLSTAGGQPVEWRTTTIRGDRYRFVSEFEVGSAPGLTATARN